jgi:hypothetical protein
MAEATGTHNPNAVGAAAAAAIKDAPADLSLVHQATMPGVWTRVRLETFPENWVVLRLTRHTSPSPLTSFTGPCSSGSGSQQLQPPPPPQQQQPPRAAVLCPDQLILEGTGAGGAAQVAAFLAAHGVAAVAPGSTPTPPLLCYGAFRVSVRPPPAATIAAAAAGFGQPEPEPEPEPQGAVPAGVPSAAPAAAPAVFVWFSWASPGADPTECARCRARDAALLRRYFCGATVECHLSADDYRRADGDVAARIQAAFERAVRTHLHRAEAGDPTSACSAAPVDLDFANSSAVTRCTHYEAPPSSSSQSAAEQEVRARF